MLQLLKQIESLSSCRDRDLLGAGVVAAIYELFCPRAATLLRLVPTHHGSAVAPVVRADRAGLHLFGEVGELGEGVVPLEGHPLLHQAFIDQRTASETRNGGFACVYPLSSGCGGGVVGFLRVDLDEAPGTQEGEALERFLRFYCNYMNLLDYSELDTLTGLLNRKTFDESFDKILAKAAPLREQAVPEAERRGDEMDGRPHWLAVMDIDHFKRVNDGFGHLFGDEVLLRIANLMRHTFRTDDRLFRFGGEEFVIMLRPATLDNARKTLDRLRRAVEGHDFPQVGQVTCSVGFTRVNPALAPTDILGQADEALYYAKEHGRNQVCCYETLIEAGLLAPQSIPAPQADIDALFD